MRNVQVKNVQLFLSVLNKIFTYLYVSTLRRKFRFTLETASAGSGGWLVDVQFCFSLHHPQTSVPTKRIRFTSCQHPAPRVFVVRGAERAGKPFSCGARICAAETILIYSTAAFAMGFQRDSSLWRGPGQSPARPLYPNIVPRPPKLIPSASRHIRVKTRTLPP